MSERLDIILFGATGHTGKNCIKYLHKLTKSNGRSLTWGVAGRSKKKLLQVQQECSRSIGTSLKSIPIFVANINDGESLNKMTSSARVLINCCGPYHYYGEAVVLACLETCTHYIDVTGEPYFMEIIYYKYNRLAKERGVYIINSCGYDCVPTDLGIVFMQQNFNGTLNTVEIYMSISSEDKKYKPRLNFATWKSAVTGKENIENLKALRKKIFQKPLPRLLPKLQRKPSLYKSDVTNTWVKRYVGADRAVVYRTQKYFYEHENTRPVQINVFQVVDSFAEVQFTKFQMNILDSILDYNFGKELILKYPSFFSGGKYRIDPPSDYESNNIRFNFIFDCSGWDKSIDTKNPKVNNHPNKKMVCKISGTNPGYGFTCFCVTLCAITVLTEKDALPRTGGVYTPGIAFGKTTLMSQLIENGMSLTIESKL